MNAIAFGTPLVRIEMNARFTMTMIYREIFVDQIVLRKRFEFHIGAFFRLAVPGAVDIGKPNLFLFLELRIEIHLWIMHNAIRTRPIMLAKTIAQQLDRPNIAIEIIGTSGSIAGRHVGANATGVREKMLQRYVWRDKKVIVQIDPMFCQSWDAMEGHVDGIAIEQGQCRLWDNATVANKAQLRVIVLEIDGWVVMIGHDYVNVADRRLQRVPPSPQHVF